ncbi:MAG: DUF5388 domain-containing protein [Lactobacillus sp.]|nr:DUF5388 domain-containing protein [Lactobacillus sp.]
MTQLINNPNSKKIIPRTKTPEPQKSVSINDFSEDIQNPKNKQVSEVTFDTTLRMSNHLKNFMKAMVILGYAPTQQKALKKIQDSYIEQLGEDERKTLKFQIATLERSDAKNINNKD